MLTHIYRASGITENGLRQEIWIATRNTAAPVPLLTMTSNPGELAFAENGPISPDTERTTTGMTRTRKIATAAALAPVALLALGSSTASAAPAEQMTGSPSYALPWYGYEDDGDDGSLVNVSENNVGPFQACNNNVPTNVLGVQVPTSDVTGILGFDNDGNSSSQVKDCDQNTTQDN
ncbi:MAG: hypothetical protein ACRDUV_18205 [Pseudonocardiaceae bacterium]